jgi:hypothetical protein
MKGIIGFVAFCHCRSRIGGRVYDLAANDGFVSVDHDTPVFAVTSIEAWWWQVSETRYPTHARS